MEPSRTELDDDVGGDVDDDVEDDDADDDVDGDVDGVMLFSALDAVEINNDPEVWCRRGFVENPLCERRGRRGSC